ncbi:GspH/FimT family pseudopilin [Shewanella litorisediminis]|uniref:Type II secretion system protein H n=1 Tax=Shewanella litorisediminis TaxID=1173586 RepID=A0ABX7G654_9GAMM|nr:GspH/FimT family pseudopilin [Shewanella litorisediminis]MCL2917551.1 GspH/FimT family pseudopilin [Shewanella litorisediminis]QRH02678.1 GspH/FimT family pseudopilin [Shewanella litorisediminis]
MHRTKQGFTLVELMVTIAVAAILLAIGVPSLTSVYEQVRVDNNVKKIHDLFAFARNQAVSYGATVKICSFASATSCGTTADWSGGIRVYVTDAANTDHELRAIDSFNGLDKVKASAVSMTFSADGLASGGTVTYCPNGKASESQTVLISTSGLVSYGANGNAC